MKTSSWETNAMKRRMQILTTASVVTASMMLMAGESPQWIASQVGHTDWTFTARTYSRFIPDDAPDAGEKAVQRWGNAGKKLSLRTSNDAK